MRYVTLPVVHDRKLTVEGDRPSLPSELLPVPPDSPDHSDITDTPDQPNQPDFLDLSDYGVIQTLEDIRTHVAKRRMVWE